MSLQGKWQKTVISKGRQFMNFIKSYNPWSFKVKTLKVIFYGLLAIACVLQVLVSSHYQFLCTLQGSKVVIKEVCNQYKAMKVHGDLCQAFCDLNAIVPTSCSNSHGNKDVAFSALFNQKKVFVKGHANANEEKFMPLKTKEDEWPSKETFSQVLSAYLYDNHGITVTKEVVIEKVFPDSKDNWETLSNNDDSLHQMMENIWSLIQDDEYVFLRLYHNIDVFPKLYGRCGNIYLVEELEPLPEPQGRFSKQKSFDEYAKNVAVAIALLDLLDELETVFHEPVHLCDIKTEHFGISDKGRLKFLDLDSIFFKSVIGNIMHMGSDLSNSGAIIGGTCQTHKECDFFDCRGECDLIKGKCKNDVVNNNLQVVCEKVLSQRKVGIMSYVNGLLTSKHSNQKIKDLLKKCSNPTGSKEDIRLKADDKTKRALYKALEHVLSFSGV